jgi:hypothetical protein
MTKPVGNFENCIATKGKPKDGQKYIERTFVSAHCRRGRTGDRRFYEKGIFQSQRKYAD